MGDIVRGCMRAGLVRLLTQRRHVDLCRSRADL
jgi:hypothetical protein